MSLATGEEQQVALHFSRSLIWSDFIENTRFTFMYDGQIHSDVAPVNGGSGVRIDGDDGEILIDIPEWAIPSSDVNINLLLGHKDWVLLGITYDDRYQVKYIDLAGLKLPNPTAQQLNSVLSGATPNICAVVSGHLIRVSCDGNTITAEPYACSPAENDKSAAIEITGYIENGVVLGAYSCQLIGTAIRNAALDLFASSVYPFNPNDYTVVVAEAIQFNNNTMPTVGIDV